MRSGERLAEFLIHPSDSVMSAAAAIDRNGEGIVLVCGANRNLLGTITDGDVRRAVLSQFDLNSSVELLIQTKQNGNGNSPITVNPRASRAQILELMNQRRLRHIPIVDDSLAQVVGLALYADLAAAKCGAPVQALIMAGGFGTRMKPLTDNQPKSMLRVGEEPLLEVIVKQLRTAGIDQIIIATHYRAENITSHFGNGSRFGVNIEYLHEEVPLGTAGVLAEIPPTQRNILVINGDVLTGLNFKDLSDFHETHDAAMTVAIKEVDVNIAFGVVQTDGLWLEEIAEKPTYKFRVNAGIYVLKPAVCQYIRKGNPTAMTDVIKLLIEKQQPVASFMVHDYWIDVGTPAHYQEANRELGHRDL